MDDLIKRQDAIDSIQPWIDGYGYNESERNIMRCCIQAIADVPSAQKKGKWEWVQYDSISELGDWYCSECEFMPAAFNLAKKHLNYCPSCGAYMRGEEEWKHGK